MLLFLCFPPFLGMHCGRAAAERERGARRRSTGCDSYSGNSRGRTDAARRENGPERLNLPHRSLPARLPGIKNISSVAADLNSLADPLQQQHVPSKGRPAALHLYLNSCHWSNVFSPSLSLFPLPSPLTVGRSFGKKMSGEAKRILARSLPN